MADQRLAIDRKETDDSEKYWRRSISTSRASEDRDQVEYSLSSEALSWNILARDAQAPHQAKIPKHMVKEGFYSIIWCISPRHLGRLLLKELFFEVETSLNKEIHLIESSA
ncbi:hypothetical protein BGZ70_009537 [Mortierella alpina]|uniref:Uncharacterized protein n=1 Tax=Mortierella alpina TaxID=64518 RepID=A0A9P6J182_MORAP|nr:hypothetical protein BGZ70_009537 [Mortierella alpina]